MEQSLSTSAATTRIIGGDLNRRGPGPEVMAADTLQGDPVLNGRNETLGKIRDIMIDVPTGTVAYAVLTVGGLMGLGDKQFAIPWPALVLDADRKCFILDIAKEVLQNAPGFDKDNWPSMSDIAWASKVYEFYNVPPYWN